MAESDAESAKPVQRRVAFVRGQWRVTYLISGESGQDAGVRRGLLVGPLMPDVTEALWVAVMPDGDGQRTMIRRDWITSIAPPRHVR